MLPPPGLPPLIGRQVSDALVGILADETGGYNATIAAWADAYEVPPWQLNFGGESAGPVNFALGNVDFDDIEKAQPVGSSSFGMVTMNLYTGSKDNADHRFREKFRLYSGIVQAVIRTRLAFNRSKAPQDLGRPPDFSKYVDLAGDALISLFNREDTQGLWSAAVAYDGDITVVPTLAAPVEEHWVQDVVAQLTFGVRVTQ